MKAFENSRQGFPLNLNLLYNSESAMKIIKKLKHKRKAKAIVAKLGVEFFVSNLKG